LGIFFTLVTDHIRLKYFFSQPNVNARQSRWLAFRSELEFVIKHIKGKENKVAYALSRHSHAMIGVSVRNIGTTIFD